MLTFRVHQSSPINGNGFQTIIGLFLSVVEKTGLASMIRVWDGQFWQEIAVSERRYSINWVFLGVLVTYVTVYGSFDISPGSHSLQGQRHGQWTPLPTHLSLSPFSENICASLPCSKCSTWWSKGLHHRRHTLQLTIESPGLRSHCPKYLKFR